MGYFQQSNLVKANIKYDYFKEHFLALKGDVVVIVMPLFPL